MILATKTLNAIDAAIKADGGAAYRANLQKILPTMNDAYSTDTFPFRSHLGASLIGRRCARALWYGFRWAMLPQHPSRIIRLFNRGHLEEARFIAMLMAIGCTVWQHDQSGKQYRISDCDGHFGGSGDGIAWGVPDVPEQYVLCEFKTHNDKSFSKLVKEGVAQAKPEHYVQMSIYMYKFGIPVALYMAVNKNDDNIHAELIYIDTAVAEQYINRAQVIINYSEPPKRLSESPGYWECRWCEFNKICHNEQLMQETCRSCIHARPVENGNWQCNQSVIKVYRNQQQQFNACEHYKQI